MKKLLMALVLVFSLVLSGCIRSEDVLPKGATNVREAGNGWVYFDLDGKTFLFFRTDWDGGKGAMITQVK